MWCQKGVRAHSNQMIDRFRTKEKKSRRLIKYCKLTNNFLKSCPNNTGMKRFSEIILVKVQQKYRYLHQPFEHSLRPTFQIWELRLSNGTHSNQQVANEIWLKLDKHEDSILTSLKSSYCTKCAQLSWLCFFFFDEICL